MTSSPRTVFDSAEPPHASTLAALAAWPALAGHLDEMRHGQGLAAQDEARMQPHWHHFFEQLGPEGLADLPRRHASLAQQLQDNGVTYNVYADHDSQQRPWALDLFPMLVSPCDWAHIEAGVLQRTRLLNHIMGDVYGPQQLLESGLLPPALVKGHPGYVRAMQGVQPIGQTWLHIAAFDLAHGPDGRWWVVSHRTQAPSGLGYLLENRIAISRQFPKAFDALHVQRLAASYKALMQGLTRMSPQGRNARMALLTPGPFNETYFEHAYLARYLGIHLVQGNDLTVRDRRVYLKTLSGLEAVDILIKRLDDQWLDPLELRADSALGVPGLMQAIRSGNLLLANAPGSAPLESSAILGFLPAICERVLGQPLTLPSLATWWCGEPASLHNALPQLQQCVIKNTWPHAGSQAVVGPSLHAADIARATERIMRDPGQHTLQSFVPLSQNPTWAHGDIVPRPAMLRVFALCDGVGSWRVLPGGLVRLAPRGQAIASMQRGGSSADCWVLTNGDVDRTSLLRSAPSTLTLALHKRGVTSRAAENLFWLGRYTERAENTVRLARTTLHCLQGEALGAPELLQWLDRCAAFNGLVLPGTPSATQSHRVFERSLIAQLGAPSGAASVGSSLLALQGAAHHVRERLSPEQRHLIESLQQQFEQGYGTLRADDDYAPQQALNLLEQASSTLSAITGAQTDRMMRDDGWRMLSVGRHIERLATLSQAMAQALHSGAAFTHDGFEAVLVFFDSTITFHAHYQQRRDLVSLVDMLVTHRDNPRAIAWVLSTLRSRIGKLPLTSPQSLDTLLVGLPNPDDWELAQLSGATHGATGQQGAHRVLLDLMQSCTHAANTLSDRLSHQFFSHADRDNSTWAN